LKPGKSREFSLGQEKARFRIEKMLGKMKNKENDEYSKLLELLAVAKI
jgi:hypothetical protein